MMNLQLPEVPHLPSWLLYTLLGSAALFLYGTWPYRHWKRRGIPGPPMAPLIGDLVRLARCGDLRRILAEDVGKFGKVYGYFLLRQPVLVVADAEMVKQIGVARAGCFTDRGIVGNNTGPLQKGVLTLRGQEWKRVRGLLTPIFSSGKVKAMFPLIEQCADQLCAAVLKEESGVIDAKIYFANYTMDVVASTLFGLKLNCQENPDNEFSRRGKRLFAFSILSWKFWALFMFPGLAQFLFNRFNISPFNAEDLGFVQRVVTDAMRQREASDSADKYHDFLASMVAARREAESQGVKGLSELEVMAQSLTFFLAGFDTTSTVMQFIPYFLAWNKDCQDRAYREVREAKERSGGALTYECVQGLQYLNCCFDEALRMCPPLLLIDRLCTEATAINGFEIQKGDIVVIPVHSLANDPEVWEDPGRFNPDRFDKHSEDKGSPRQTHLIPFGVGARNCIGMRLAQVAIRKALAEMLLKLEFLPAPDTRPFHELEFDFLGLMKPKEPIRLRVVKRTVA